MIIVHLGLVQSNTVEMNLEIDTFSFLYHHHRSRRCGRKDLLSCRTSNAISMENPACEAGNSKSCRYVTFVLSIGTLSSLELFVLEVLLGLFTL